MVGSSDFSPDGFAFSTPFKPLAELLDFYNAWLQRMQ